MADELGVEYAPAGSDARYGEAPSMDRVTGQPWRGEYVTAVGGLVLTDGASALVIEGPPEDLHAFLDRLRSTIPPNKENPA